MSLIVRIDVNHHHVEVVAARRTAGEEDADSLNVYEVRRFDVRSGNVRQLGDTVEVIHRYGDGPTRLAYLALGAALAEHPQTTGQPPGEKEEKA